MRRLKKRRLSAASLRLSPRICTTLRVMQEQSPRMGLASRIGKQTRRFRACQRSITLKISKLSKIKTLNWQIGTILTSAATNFWSTDPKRNDTTRAWILNFPSSLSRMRHSKVSWWSQPRRPFPRGTICPKCNQKIVTCAWKVFNARLNRIPMKIPTCTRSRPRTLITTEWKSKTTSTASLRTVRRRPRATRASTWTCSPPKW